MTVAPDTDIDAARHVAAAVARAGLVVTEACCIHQPPVPGCPPCAEVALQLALAHVQEVRADFAI